MNPWAIIPLISFIAFTILLVVVLPQARKRVNRLFAVFLFASEIWSFTAFMLLYNVNATTQYLLFWNGLVITAIPLVVVTYYHFLRVYNHKPGGMVVYVGYTVVLAILVSSLAGVIVKDAYFVGDMLHHDIAPWEFIISATLTPFLVLTISILLKRYRKSTDPIDRNRTAYLIFGWSVLLVISYITPFTPALKTLPTDHLGNLINALIISYAITRFSLLDIRMVARKGLKYIILIVAVIGLCALGVTLGSHFLAHQPAIYIILVATLVIFIAIIAARPLMQFVELFIDRIFYRNTYDYRKALLNFSDKMGNILDLDALAKEMMPAMVNAMNITKTKLMFQDTESGDFKVRYSYPKLKDDADAGLNFNPESPVVEWLDKQSQPLYMEQMENIPEMKGLWQKEKDQLEKSGLGALYPFKSRGKLIGILGMGKKSSGGPYAHEDIQLIAGITNQAGVIIENAQLYQQAKTRANTDELTSLYNHRSFHERIEQEIARGSRFGGTFSLIMMDIDLFKSYNDIYGHLAGDQVLRKVGKYLESSIRGIDLAFRYGGEEFAVILPEARLDDAYKVAERIRKTIESKSSSRAMPITASLGVGNWPNDGVMKEEVISLTDAALYRAKQTGRNRTCLSSDVLKPDTSLIGVELEARPRALSIIYALAATVDAKDSYTYGHSRKVSEYAVAVAEAYNLPQDRISTIRAASLLHDIGKVGVPDSILNKKTPLTEEEWKPIKAHPELGVEILRHVIDLVNCLPAILHHHEHHDGSGYPAGLSGNGIPLEARILSVADAYDAMTSLRSYHKQLSVEEALEEIKRCAGTQFDPEVVKIFCGIIQPSEHPKSLDTKNRLEDDTGTEIS